MRAGRYISQPSGYRSLVPAPLPPDPLLHLDAELPAVLSRASPNAPRLLDYLFIQPIVGVNQVKTRLGVTFQTADSLAKQFIALGLLAEITGGQRSRKFRYSPYLSLFDRPESIALHGL